MQSPLPSLRALHGRTALGNNRASLYNRPFLTHCVVFPRVIITCSTLNLERIDAGELTIELRPCALRSVLRDVAAGMAPIARSAGITMRLHIPSAAQATTLGIPVNSLSLIDEGKIGQVLRNLVSSQTRKRSSPRRRYRLQLTC